MSCNCNTADPLCEPCAICTPPGVRCLPNCNPKDPCEEKIDTCCVIYTGQDLQCNTVPNGILTGDPLCDVLVKFLEIEFYDVNCCLLELSIDVLP